MNIAAEMEQQNIWIKIDYQIICKYIYYIIKREHVYNFTDPNARRYLRNLYPTIFQTFLVLRDANYFSSPTTVNSLWPTCHKVRTFTSVYLHDFALFPRLCVASSRLCYAFVRIDLVLPRNPQPPHNLCTFNLSRYVHAYLCNTPSSYFNNIHRFLINSVNKISVQQPKVFDGWQALNRRHVFARVVREILTHSIIFVWHFVRRIDYCSFWAFPKDFYHFYVSRHFQIHGKVLFVM